MNEQNARRPAWGGSAAAKSQGPRAPAPPGPHALSSTLGYEQRPQATPPRPKTSNATLGYEERDAGAVDADPVDVSITIQDAPPVSASIGLELAATIAVRSEPVPEPEAPIASIHSAPTVAVPNAGVNANHQAETLDAATERSAKKRALLLTRSTTVLPRVSRTAAPTALSGEAQPRYEAQKVLGEGGMGEVILARDNDIDRTVAIKRLHADLSSGDAIHRFADEVRTVGALQHPNIVPVYDVGLDHENQPYFVMKFIEGESLEGLIEKLAAGDEKVTAHLTTTKRIEIVIQLLHALEHAHASGIVHRDIKPANVMVGGHGEVTVADWGIAKKVTPRVVAPLPTYKGRPPAPKFSFDMSPMVGALLRGLPQTRLEAAPGSKLEKTIAVSELAASGAAADRPHGTRLGDLLGTPFYMSPEQAAGKNHTLDDRSDIYSVSVLLGEFVGLRHYLADKTSLAAVLDGVTTEEFHLRYMKELVAVGVQAELCHVILKGMARDPELRWQSASEMIDALQRVLSGDIWVCCPFTFTRRMTYLIHRFVVRHPQFVTVAIFAVPVGLLASLAGVAWLALH